ncbi:hypothetical protein ATANTOWER_032378 [Ataeniobius toweri]|uniref:Uncharacterized protein n=1 Tax=Ataeniobius toweri TaxID=208326 RepID=A0ABU7AX85_9TELE|nr:hypothetical protein [Ataeniobius toweri]
MREFESLGHEQNRNIMNTSTITYYYSDNKCLKVLVKKYFPLTGMKTRNKMEKLNHSVFKVEHVERELEKCTKETQRKRMVDAIMNLTPPCLEASLNEDDFSPPIRSSTSPEPSVSLHASTTPPVNPLENVQLSIPWKWKVKMKISEEN